MQPLIGLAIIIFIFYQLWQVVRYIYHRATKPEEKKPFPIAAALIFAACFIFYLLAFLNT